MTTSQTNYSKLSFGIDPAKHKSGAFVCLFGTPIEGWLVDPSNRQQCWEFRRYLYGEYFEGRHGKLRIHCEASGHGKFSNFEVNRAGGKLVEMIMSIADPSLWVIDETYSYPMQWRKQWFGTASAEQMGITKKFTWKHAARKSLLDMQIFSEDYLNDMTDDEVEACCLSLLCDNLFRGYDETKVQKVRRKKQRRMVSEAA